MNNITNALLVIAGGGGGSLLRYCISLGIAKVNIAVFPVATLISNLLSVIIVGLTFSAFANGSVSENTRLLIVTGFCGGLSTFSTFN